jgi:hypothetical protein
MKPTTPLDRVVASLRSRRFTRFRDEAELQRLMAGVFAEDGIAALREHALSAKDRPDFYFEGVAVEVKIGGSTTSLARQLFRYAEVESVTALVLVSTRARHTTMPTTMVGKPVVNVHVGGFV